MSCDVSNFGLVLGALKANSECHRAMDWWHSWNYFHKYNPKFPSVLLVCFILTSKLPYFWQYQNAWAMEGSSPYSFLALSQCHSLCWDFTKLCTVGCDVLRREVGTSRQRQKSLRLDLALWKYAQNTTHNNIIWIKQKKLHLEKRLKPVIKQKKFCLSKKGQGNILLKLTATKLSSLSWACEFLNCHKWQLLCTWPKSFCSMWNQHNWITGHHSWLMILFVCLFVWFVCLF